MREATFTVGVEEEYQLVDPESGALRGRAQDVLGSGKSARPEFRRTMFEVDTTACPDAATAGRLLHERRLHAARLAADHGLAIAAAGLHPVGPYPEDQLSDVAVYHQLAGIGGASTRELHLFGMHVHVMVPNPEAAVRAMGGVAQYLPGLLALSASSPFHRGQDTRFVSFRTLLRDMSPRVAPPLPVATAREYDRLVRILSGDDPIRPGESPIAWDARPSARFPTLEFRLCDVCPRLDAAVLLIAAVRALTAMFADRPAPPCDGIHLQLMRENRWRAARYGLDARFFRLDPPAGDERSARDTIRAMVDRLGPIAERLGDGAILADAERILARGTAADEMRGVYERTGSYAEVLRWVAGTTIAG